MTTILALLQAGTSAPRIAALTGASLRTIHAARRAEGLPPARGGRPPAERPAEIAVLLRQPGATDKGIARLLGVPPAVVRRIRSAEGIAPVRRGRPSRK